MIRQALEYIVGLAERRTVEIGGRCYSHHQLHLIERPKIENAWTTFSLDAVVAWLVNGTDLRDNPKYVGRLTIYVSARRVEIHSSLGVIEDGRRELLFLAKSPQDFVTERLGRQLSHEDFVIWAQANFEQTKELKNLLAFLSRIQKEDLKVSEDDGVTQIAAVKRGIRIDREPVQNPVTLRPYRSFHEIEQPECQFILRIAHGGNQELTIALHEVQDGRWYNEAAKRIETYLRNAMCAVPTREDWQQPPIVR